MVKCCPDRGLNVGVRNVATRLGKNPWKSASVFTVCYCWLLKSSFSCQAAGLWLQKGMRSAEFTSSRSVDKTLTECLDDCLADVNCLSVDWNNVAIKDRCYPYEHYERHEEVETYLDYYNYLKICPEKVSKYSYTRFIIIFSLP